MSSPKKHIGIGIALFGLGVGLSAILGRSATQSSLREWYPKLKKPSYQPPEIAFPIAWSILYPAIAVAGARIWAFPDSPQRSQALVAWNAQLVFNAAWSELFFRHRRPDWALVDQALLIGSILWFIKDARRLDRPAALLFVPYLTWVGFAALLNEEILRLNPPLSQWDRLTEKALAARAA